MVRFQALRGGLIAIAIGLFLFTTHTAHALPSFALQTGMPCTSCHIGAFGPQLTRLGRAFKIGGYTQKSADGWQSTFPVALMFLGSYTNTQQGQGMPAAQHFGPNGNFALDDISAFFAGRITDYAGAFVQGSFNGITSAFKLDNTDLRLTTPLSVGDTELRLGLSVNNNPTVQDPYNSTYAWGYPYASSALAPTPAAQPILVSALSLNSLGATVYGWYDRSLYLEAGLYNTYGPSLLRATGSTYGPGSTSNPAPYLRVAYEWDWAGQSAYIGGLFFNARINPKTGPFSVDGTMGQDTFTDYVADAGYQYLGDGTHTFAAQAIFDHETQALKGSTNAGASSQSGNNLNQIRANLTYYYQQTYGVTAAWQKTWGKQNPLLYAPAPLTGSANGKPNSNAFILEADWVPFGKADSWAGPWVNLKLGVQYTIYTQFNGGSKNYDGFGRDASGNNTLYVFAWMAF